jgi:hypothetical protein
MPPKKRTPSKPSTTTKPTPTKSSTARRSKLAKENDISAEEEAEIKSAWQLFSVKAEDLGEEVEGYEGFVGEKEGVLRTRDLRGCMA